MSTARYFIMLIFGVSVVNVSLILAAVCTKGKCTCPDNCKDNCDDNGTCKSCYPGYKGNTCEQVCPIYTYGANCSQKCSENCLKKECFPINGDCKNGCVNGYYSAKCQACPKGCINNTCDISSGLCKNGCKSGFTGEKCERPCSSGFFGANCSQTCSSKCVNKKCYHEDGKCQQGCEPGYYGNKCSASCPPQCLNKTCNQSTGKCLQGCNAGYHGSSCHEACRQGMHGLRCLSLCPPKCTNQTCQPETGHCIYCLAGYTGSMCDVPCPNNTFGASCNETCSSQCRPLETNRTRCDHETGACLQGCQEGYEGFQCTNKVTKQLFPITTAILINLIFGLVILLVLIAALARWRKNQKRGHLRVHDSSVNNKDYSVMSFSRQSECVYEVPVLRGKENSNSSLQEDTCDKDGNEETLSIDSTYQNTKEAQKDTSAQVNLNSDLEVLKERADDDLKEPLFDDQEVYANCSVAKLDNL